ncbi:MULTISPECIES: 2-(1,2-epoxy-1,2-dihydrophenyl)acetyl-CoA isomerase PaaG [unclassified Halomonas]|uniref:2-(1,2-epoxy-1,2-dihydrophenyl)acetyl-CoA isomerase PaaG n=1 Tax=unclassified Halomonas TaxID=2609666 RepID=UPI0028877BC8|nr:MULTISPECIES: 2-(1,2-epoxy-1,2-dihydrophenyl)acetyl-CoA isomerase PaaG [unclassified Halomonas]MDT0500136.1 2-(1,2-epoxy-1,2-dihydrophenyl)acetyl-CoA isomerase PaaG [Halomonas sp. PAR7]MDT0512541.1 2-(1,2-epoxy-1,2-dihydrophenyl)acetyl-CoA isomerase PaaG [Halomonas sp. LES1]MDT0591175.1 2-(1,2-epoxy-1,2-dihydrophenyl)acetyl-CoA isomerase PaaG [Halomonas sp. PAR8]
MSEAPLLYSVEDGVARITLNRPDSLNSFNAEMHAEMRQALKAVRQDESVRALLLTGNGRGFSAGQDLSDRNVAPGAEAPDLGESLEKRYNPMLRTIRDLPIPTICAVNGVAAGAGANIALACDIVLAARSASFIQAFCKIGLIPDSGGTWSLPHLVGMARAKGLAMLGDKLSAEQAEQWGMIWKVVDDDSLQDESRALARHLATQPTRGLALIKRALHASTDNSFDAQLDLERDLQRLAGRTDDYREGVSAFMEKRQPNFKGE